MTHKLSNISVIFFIQRFWINSYWMCSEETKEVQMTLILNNRSNQLLDKYWQTYLISFISVNHWRSDCWLLIKTYQWALKLSINSLWCTRNKVDRDLDIHRGYWKDDIRCHCCLELESILVPVPDHIESTVDWPGATLTLLIGASPEISVIIVSGLSRLILACRYQCQWLLYVLNLISD